MEVPDVDVVLPMVKSMVTGRAAFGSMIDGYVYIWADPMHPFYQSMSSRKGGANSNSRYFSEHRLVMAEHLGRPLLRIETVRPEWDPR